MNEEKKRGKFWLKIIFFCFTITLLTFLYSRYIESTSVVVKEINIVNSNIPKSFYGYKLAHLSDIHYNTTIGKSELKATIKNLNKSKPNIVVITGDIFDIEVQYKDSDIDELANILNSINGKYRYIITGDQDLKNKDYFEKLLKKIDFKLLDNTYDIIYNGDYDPLLIGGLSTRNDSKDISEKVNEIETAITENKTYYNILLIHEPNIVSQINHDNYQLILAGHTNNGQVNIPGIKYILTPVKDRKYKRTYYKLDNTDLYISKGIGTTNIKARLFNKPTINLYRLLDK